LVALLRHAAAAALNPPVCEALELHHSAGAPRRRTPAGLILRTARVACHRTTLISVVLIPAAD